MTKEQIIRMARDAALQDEFGVSEFAYTDRLEHFAVLVAAKGRMAAVEEMRKIVKAAYPTESTSAGLAMMLDTELDGLADK